MSGVTEDLFLASAGQAADAASANPLAGVLDNRAVASRGGAAEGQAWHFPHDRWQRSQKTVFDCLAATCLLLLLAPFLALVALLIALDSRGPVLFRQPRTGLNNRSFTIYKFRTMHHAMADTLADQQTVRNDPRVTRVGATLRKLSIDELPQLINVLRGDMSLVGPRPHAPNTKAAGQLFADVVQNYALRHRVKPGITGWAQVNGFRGETETLDKMQRRVEHDLAYVDGWSLMLDLRILFLTVFLTVFDRNAY